MAKQVEQLNRSDTEEQHNLHQKHAKKLPSAFLLSGTAAALFAEATLHNMSPMNREVWRASIGGVQKNMGLLGTWLYASKCLEDPTPNNLAMTMGYLLFNLEGFSRMLEANKSHLPNTGILGMGAAATKAAGAASDLCRVSYLLDLLANTIESRHGTARPTGKGVVSAIATVMWKASHSMSESTVSRIQIAAGMAMLSDAAGKVHNYLSTMPETALEPDESQKKEDEYFAKFDNFLVGLHNGDPKLEQGLEDACGAVTPEECERKFVALVEEYAKAE